MSLPYDDGGIPHGSLVLSITDGTTPVSYVAENIQPSKDVTILERRNEVGAPSGQKFIKNFEAGTATLQLASGTTKPPQEGYTFDADLWKTGGTAPTWAINSVSLAYEHMGETKVNISFRRKIN